ncbi:MAG: TFIIB-type zinc ribbon-containing protein [Clostridia bacterium]|nr:TFIIB-type zinc ribbon-containing protein [Clostridia bacterium]
MSATVTFKCPNCGAGLVFDAEKQSFSCEFCLSSFTEEELLGSDSERAAEAEARENEEFSAELNEYHCNSCGAEIIADRSTVADFCYYCHNPIVLADRVSGIQKPTKIIPFRFNKEEAKEIFLRYAKKKLFLPKDYFSPEQSDKITGVYYPFWVVDADTHANLTATGKRIRTWRAGNYRYTETSSFAVSRDGEIHFEDLSASAISTEDKAMLEGILPYQLNEHIDFSMPYLQGFIAKKRDIESDRLSAELRGKMAGYASTILSGTVRGYSAVVDKRTELTVKGSRWDYTLMPVWMLTYQRGGRTYTYAMNGSTGKIYGELPVSKPKLAILGSIAAAVIGALSFLIGWGVFL